MSRLKTLAMLVILSVSNLSTFADHLKDRQPSAEGDSPSPPPVKERSSTPAKRPDPPVPPLKYLEAGARLFNKGRYELASRYLNAAQAFRHRLTPNERVVLDVYRDRLDEYSRDQNVTIAASAKPVTLHQDKVKAAVTVDGIIATSMAENPSLTLEAGAPLSPSPVIEGQGASPLGTVATHQLQPAASPVTPGVNTSSPTGEFAGSSQGTETWRDTSDLKQKARWLLQVAREQVFRGQYDAATRTIEEVKRMDIRWKVFDDTPAKVSESLAKAQALRPAVLTTARAPETSADQLHNRRTAKAKLREARALLALDNQSARAEAILREVKSWNLRYGVFDDTPEKIAASLAAARRREAVRNAEHIVKSYALTNVARDPSTAAAVPVNR
ncbi:MAG: hypothetical protein NVSMB9_01250 [Isosphaeraceae bacterium]